MFKIYTDNILMYDDEDLSEELKVINPKLSLSQSSAGTFTMTVPPGNVGYDHLDRLTSLIRIFKNTQVDPYWEGRILSETTDFWNCKQITCEGILGVLNDTIQPPNHYQNQTARSFLTALLNEHNSKVETWKKIYIGNTDAQLASSHRYTNYESTLECIHDKLVEREGGYIRLRWENGLRKLDYLTVYPSENSQKIEFGKNLLDFSKTFSSEDFCTVLVPRGAQLDEGPYEALTPYVDVSSVNNGSIYVTLTNDDFDTPPAELPVDEFGWIEAVHDWEDVYYPSHLLTKAKAFLKDVQFDNMQLEVSALDMRYAGAQYEEINLNDTVRIVSVPHGLDRLFPVTKLEIPLDQPENTKFTLGTNVNASLTHRNKENIAIIKNDIAALPTEQTIREKAKEDAEALIDSAITGYINIVHNPETGAEEFIVSTSPDYSIPNENTKFWRWTAAGLGFYTYEGDPLTQTLKGIAITNDGGINAEFVITGSLVADKITSGELTDQHGGNTFYLNLNTGELRIGQLTTALNKLDNIGGRNLIINTLNSDSSAIDNLPRLYQQIDFSRTNGWTYLSASHGVRLTKGDSSNVLGYTMGASNPTAQYAGMNGLFAGSTYTVSFIFTGKVLTTEREARWRYVFASFDENNASTVQEIWTEPITNGVEESHRVVATFTIPNDAVSCCLQIGVRYLDTGISPTASDYDSTDFYQFEDMKLEAGEVATAWSPAPEDYEAMIETGDRQVYNSWTETLRSQVEITNAAINTNLQAIQTLNGDANEEGSVKNLLYLSETKTAKKYTLAIGEAVGYANSVVDKVQARFDFTSDGLEISGTDKSSPDSKLKLASDRVSLYQNNSERLWLDQNGANADSFNANNFVKIGTSTTGKYLWEVYSGGFRLRKE